MRKFTRTLLMLLLFAAIFPFLYPWKDGKPLLSWSQLSLPQLPQETMPTSTPSPSPDEEDTRERKREPNRGVMIYRWRGSDGEVQFGSTPPPKGVAFESVEVLPDANLIQSTTAVAPADSADEPSPATSPLPTPLTVSPEQLKQLFEDAHRLQQFSTERLQQQQELLR